MRTYIKKFENESEYAAFVNSSGFVTPNVSAWEIESGETEVNFNKTKPEPIDTHKYVDLGLPSGTLWATENIKDANGNELYFAWGETQGYTSGQAGTDKSFYKGDYDFYGQNNEMTKYNETDEKTILESSDDAASQIWGFEWRIPTKEEFEELISNTNSAFTQIDGVSGVLLTSKVNGNTLFLSGDGHIFYADKNTWFTNFSEKGFYWSSSLSDNKNAANYMLIYDGYLSVENNYRWDGYSIRPVKKLS